MQDKILSNLHNPQQLEQLYRENQLSFEAAFNAIYPRIQDNVLARGWHSRLHYKHAESNWGTTNERLFVIIASLLTAWFAKLPSLLTIDPWLFYLRNTGFIVFPALISYFAWRHKLSRKTVVWSMGYLLLMAVFVNLLPTTKHSDTLVLTCIHGPVLLWLLLGFTFGGGRPSEQINWFRFLRYNGEWVVMTTLLLLAGGIMTGLTIGLFEWIGWHISSFYFSYVVICGLAALPLISTFLIQSQPALVSSVSPVIAELFSPLALLILIIYLAATIVSGKDPYHDREFLLLFNGLLLGVMALIFFSIAGRTSPQTGYAQIVMLFLLTTATVVVDGVALSAVLFRLIEGGVTPNRAAVLGANVLMLLHLLYIGVGLLQVLTKKTDLMLVNRSMTFFLPIYGVWSGLVTFLFPFLFDFR